MGAGAWGAVAQGVTDIASSALGQWQQNKAYHKARIAYRRRYQDTVRDMRLAGLNPILAMGNAQVGGMGPPGVISTPRSDVSGAVNSATMLREQIKLLRSETELNSQKRWTEVQLADKIANESDSTAYDMWRKRATIMEAIDEAKMAPEQRRAIINELNSRTSAHSARAQAEREGIPQIRFRSGGGGSIGPLLDSSLLSNLTRAFGR